MKVKDVFLTRLALLRRQAGEGLCAALDIPLITQALSCLLWLGMGYLLASLRIGGSCTPLGLALVGAAGPGLGGASALMGVCIGSVSALGLTDGLRSAAIAVLIYAVSFGFYDTRWFRIGWFLPLAAGCVDLAVGIPLLSEQNWLPRATVLAVLEGVATAAGVWCFRRALFPAGSVPEICSDLIRWFRRERTADPAQAGCLCLLAAALLSALTSFTLAGLSPARVAGLAGVLLLGTYLSPASGACAGVLFGFGADLALNRPPYHTALFCLAGMLAGVCGRRRRLLGALCCGGTALLMAAAWSGLSLLFPAEAALAGVLLLLLPRRWFTSVRSRKPRPPVVSPAVPVITQVRQQLEAQSAAFHSVYHQLRLALSQSPTAPLDPMLPFLRTSERVCTSCIKYHRCWRQQASATRTALSAAYPRLAERGQGATEDFPTAFTQQCVHFPAFLAGVNQEFCTLLAQRQFQARVRESREAVCCQYQETARLLSHAASALSARPREDLVGTKRLTGYLRRQGIPAQGRVLYDPYGHLMVELLGNDLSLADRPEVVAALSPLLSLSLRRGSLSAQPEGQRLTLVQREPYTVSAGIAALPRQGDSVSGDTCRWFKGEDGILRVILSDGMGCGSGAARESRLVTRLLEGLLQAGLEPEAALRTVCSALGLRGEAGGGYSTIDLLTVDLFTRQGVLYKLGAAPSYLCRRSQVHRISGGALPAGAEGPFQSPAVTHLPLETGDTLLLVSDGLSDGDSDDWLRRGLLAGHNLDARSLALALVNQGSRLHSSRDDQTALVLRISQRLG